MVNLSQGPLDRATEGPPGHSPATAAVPLGHSAGGACATLRSRESAEGVSKRLKERSSREAARRRPRACVGAAQLGSAERRNSQMPRACISHAARRD